MKLLVARRFHKDGKPDIVVDAFDMGSSGDAFGVFTHDLDGEDAAVGQGSTYKAGLLSFWKDRYFLSVYAEEETAETKGLVLELGRPIAAAIPGEGPRPGLREAPAARRARGGERPLFPQSLGPQLSFLRRRHGHPAPRADGRRGPGRLRGSGGARSRLLVVEYADRGEAARAGASFVRAYMPDAGGKTGVRTENGKWTAVRVRGRHVAVVFDEESEGTAGRRLDAVEALIGQDRRREEGT